MEVGLKANKGFAYFRDTPMLRCWGPVTQFEKMRQLRLVELADAFANVYHLSLIATHSSRPTTLPDICRSDVSLRMAGSSPAMTEGE